MTISERDRRALKWLGAAAAAALAVFSWPQGGASVVKPSETPQMAEKRLGRMRQVALQVPGKQAAFKRASDELAIREKGMIQADTAAQAQAQLLQILRKLTRAQAPPVEIRSTELGQPRPHGEDYGEVSVSISLDCRVEQLINLLSDISAQPELIATNDLRIGGASDKEKVIPIRLTVSGIVSRKLIPRKKGLEF